MIELANEFVSTIIVNYVNENSIVSLTDIMDYMHFYNHLNQHRVEYVLTDLINNQILITGRDDNDQLLLAYNNSRRNNL